MYLGGVFDPDLTVMIIKSSTVNHFQDVGRTFSRSVQPSINYLCLHNIIIGLPHGAVGMVQTTKETVSNIVVQKY